MSKLFKYIAVGMFIGIIDVIPMILMKLTWDANISAFSMWVVISVMLYFVKMNLNQYIKSIFISFLVLIPNAILIVWNNPLDILPVIGMTIILSLVMGVITKKIENTK